LEGAERSSTVVFTCGAKEVAVGEVRDAATPREGGGSKARKGRVRVLVLVDMPDGGGTTLMALAPAVVVAAPVAGVP
jgi:hypothetical protein